MYKSNKIFYSEYSYIYIFLFLALEKENYLKALILV
jgi:hypothetical protein